MADQGGNTPQATQELTIFVQNLLQQMVRTNHNAKRSTGIDFLIK